LQFIYRYKIILTLLCLFFLTNIYGQGFRMMDPHIYDLKTWHFGVSFSGNYGKIKVIRANDYLNQDEVLNITTIGTPGLGLSAITDLRLGKYFNLRTNAGLNFHQRILTYKLKDGKTSRITLESVTFDLPVLIKYKSAIHNKFVRFYVVGGGRIWNDFQSRAQEERGPFKELLALKQVGLAYELGAGMDFYLPYFKFSPEIKMVVSAMNMHSPDKYVYSKALGGLYPRMIQFSMHFE